MSVSTQVTVQKDDAGIAEMFNQMLGETSANITIAYPRYVRIKALCNQLIKLFESVAKSPLFTRADLADVRAELETFCAASKAVVAKNFSIDLTAYEWNLTLVDESMQKKFTAVYMQCKKLDLLKTFIIMCDRLVPYKVHFRDLNKLNHKFIIGMPGLEWMPFPFTSMNYKYLLGIPGVAKNTTAFLMTVLNKAYEFSKAVYDELQTPDIDIDEFIKVIMVNLDKLQKIPELSRCREAFAKIKDSVELMKTNFNSYYRDYINTGDQSIMMQNFIMDVGKSSESNIRVSKQFRDIINYYRKVASNEVKDPKMKALFDRVGEQFNQNETGTENLVNIRKFDEEETPDSDSIMALVSPAALSVTDADAIMTESAPAPTKRKLKRK